MFTTSIWKMCTFHLLISSFILFTSGSNFSSGFSDGGSIKNLILMHFTVERVNLLFLLHGPTETNRIIILLFNLCSLSLCLSLRINSSPFIICASLFILCPSTATPSIYYIFITNIYLPSPPAATLLLFALLSLIIIIIIY
jgi:hypothetical protein